MMHEDHKSATQALLNAEKQREQIGLLSLKHPEMKMEYAYAIQNQILRAKQAVGRSVKGWKIGLTSKSMQYVLNIHIPDSGVLFDDMLFDHKGHVPKGRLIKPRVEAEIAFVFKSPLGGDRLNTDHAIEATDYVCPSLEILDTRLLGRIPKAERHATSWTPLATTPPMRALFWDQKNIRFWPTICAGLVRLCHSKERLRKQALAQAC